MPITISTIARNENEFLEEFFIYYKEILGAEHILFFDDSDNDIQKNICSYYSDYVTHIPWLGKGHKEEHEHALKICQTPYIGFFDIDEFLVLKKHNNINDYIADTFTGNIVLTLFNWRVFGSMNFLRTPSSLITSTYTKCLPDKNIKLYISNKHPNSKWKPNVHKKYIVKVEACEFAGIHKADVNGETIEANTGFDYSTVQLNHYQSKSLHNVIMKDLQGYKYKQKKRTIDTNYGKRGIPFWRTKALKAIGNSEMITDEFLLQYHDQIVSSKRINYTDTYEEIENASIPDLSEFDLTPEEKEFCIECYTKKSTVLIEAKR